MGESARIPGLLCDNDAFWSYLADIACRKAKRDSADALRAKLPELLLQIHYDIALAPGTKQHRIAYHIGLVKKSAFPQAAKAAVQRESYTRFIARVPDTVWQIDTLDPAVIKTGTDAITEFLKIDPGCIPALEDAVRLEVRLTRSHFNELQAAGDNQAVRDRILKSMKQVADEWGPYFDQLLSAFAGTTSSSANLEAWKSRGEPEAWVRRHLDGWNHDDWLELLVSLRQSQYWPMQEAAIGQHLEMLRAKLKTPEFKWTTSGYTWSCSTQPGPPAKTLIHEAPSGFTRREVAALDEEVRQKLAFWYRVMGDVLRASDHHEESIKYYQSGVRAAPADDDEYGRCTRSQGEAMAYVAREKAHKGEAGAREFCERTRAHPPLTITAYRMLANAYALLHEFDTAEALCKSGAALEPDLTDIEAIQEHEKDRERLMEYAKEIAKERKRYRAHEQIEEGQEHMKKSRFSQAVACFTSAQALVPDEPAVFFFRAQCYLGLGDPEKASKDAQEFWRMLPKDAPKEMREAATRLQQQVKECGEDFRKFGGQVPNLRREAAIAYKADKYAVAESKLREAIRICPAAGKHDVECELAIVLANWAVHEVNEAGFGMSISTVSTAKTRLQEAVRLDPSNEYAKTNLHICLSMISR